MIATISMVLAPGVLCIAAFAYLNFVLQPKWFPNDLPRDKTGVITAAATGSSSRGVHILLGIGEALLFLAGVTLLTAGSTMIGTSLGYARF